MHIGQMVLRSAQQRPNAPATWYAELHFTWDETADRMQRIAGALREGRVSQERPCRHFVA